MMKPSVLVVEDDRGVRRALLNRLRLEGYEAAAEESAPAALERLAEGSWDLLVADLRLPGMDGIALMHEARRIFPELPVIIITGQGTVESAVLAMHQGATDYLSKPVRFAELDARLRKAAQLGDLRRELARLRATLDETAGTCGLVIASSAMRRVWERLELFARHEAPVLIVGETGTGKEVVARALHQLRRHSAGPFVAVASGAVPAELAESELFGHEKGAFTGATRLHKGSFERAHRGTLLLDDVDDLPPPIQVKLLRVLQEGRISRVGSEREIPVDVRIVATTKVDLAQAAAEGKIREDFYYRLRGLEIALPPLREQLAALPALALHLLGRISHGDGERSKTLTPEVLEVLSRHAWPGNVRELRRVLETAVALCRGEEITPDHLPEFLLREDIARKPYSLHLEGLDSLPFQQLVRGFEDELIAWALAKAAGKQGRAGELLGLPRSTLQSKLRR